MSFKRKPRARRRNSDPINRLLRRRKLTRRTIVAILVLIALSVVLDRLGYFKYDGDDWKQFDQKSWFVSHVVDGDTVVVRDAIGRETHVRLIGVDAPEMHFGSDAPPDYWAERATQYLEARAEGKMVILRLEPTQTRDKYGRLLAYLYASDTDNLNLDLIRDGQVYADRRFAHTFRNQFETTESEARKKRTGLWADVRPDQMPPWRQDWLKRKAEERVADYQ